jgi:hypothetical protein
MHRGVKHPRVRGAKTTHETREEGRVFMDVDDVGPKRAKQIHPGWDDRIDSYLKRRDQ